MKSINSRNMEVGMRYFSSGIFCIDGISYDLRLFFGKLFHYALRWCIHCCDRTQGRILNRQVMQNDGFIVQNDLL